MGHVAKADGVDLGVDGGAEAEEQRQGGKAGELAQDVVASPQVAVEQEVGFGGEAALP